MFGGKIFFDIELGTIVRTDGVCPFKISQDDRLINTDRISVLLINMKLSRDYIEPAIVCLATITTVMTPLCLTAWLLLSLSPYCDHLEQVYGNLVAVSVVLIGSLLIAIISGLTFLLLLHGFMLPIKALRSTK